MGKGNNTRLYGTWARKVKGVMAHEHGNQHWALWTWARESTLGSVNMAGEITMDNVEMDTENDAMHCGYLWKWGNNISHCGHWHGKQWWAFWIWKRGKQR